MFKNLTNTLIATVLIHVENKKECEAKRLLPQNANFFYSSLLLAFSSINDPSSYHLWCELCNTSPVRAHIFTQYIRLTFRPNRVHGTHSAGHLTFRSTYVFPVSAFSISFCEKYSKMKYVLSNQRKFNLFFSTSSIEFCAIESFQMMKWNSVRSMNITFCQNYQ